MSSDHHASPRGLQMMACPSHVAVEGIKTSAPCSPVPSMPPPPGSHSLLPAPSFVFCPSHQTPGSWSLQLCVPLPRGQQAAVTVSLSLPRFCSGSSESFPREVLTSGFPPSRDPGLSRMLSRILCMHRAEPAPMHLIAPISDGFLFPRRSPRGVWSPWPAFSGTPSRWLRQHDV